MKKLKKITQTFKNSLLILPIALAFVISSSKDQNPSIPKPNEPNVAASSSSSQNRTTDNPLAYVGEVHNGILDDCAAHASFSGLSLSEKEM